MFIGPIGIGNLQRAGKSVLCFNNPIFDILQAEISDNDAILDLDALQHLPVLTCSVVDGGLFHYHGRGFPLDEVLKHPTLFDAYPELRQVLIGKGVDDLPGSGTNSCCDEKFMILHALSKRTPQEDVIHETQHVIQSIEKYRNARGIHVSMLKLPEKLQKVLYYASPLEREARNVVARMWGSSRKWFEETRLGIGEPKTLKALKYLPSEYRYAYELLISRAAQREWQKVKFLKPDTSSHQAFYDDIIHRYLANDPHFVRTLGSP